MKKHSVRIINRIVAGVMAIILVVGLSNHEGIGTGVQAQKPTLPGIEKIVADAKENGLVYTMLEVVATKEDATLGYLVGGQEPYYKGKALEDMPHKDEREIAVSELESALQDSASKVSQLGSVSSGDAMFSYAKYEEKESGAKTQEIVGGFETVSAGDYAVTEHGAEYELKTDSPEHQILPKYDKRYRFEEKDENNASYPQVTVTYSTITGTSARPETVYNDGTQDNIAIAYGRYEIKAGVKLSEILAEGFAADDYVGKQVYARTSVDGVEHYTYVGDFVYRETILDILPPQQINTFALSNEPEDLFQGNDTVSEGDATISDGNAIVSEGDAGPQTGEPEAVTVAELDDLEIMPIAEPTGDTNKDICLYNKATGEAYIWATHGATGYTFDHTMDGNVAEGYVVQFDSNPYGDYYISRATKAAQEGNMILIELYERNDDGKYVQTKAPGVTFAYSEGNGNSRFYKSLQGAVNESFKYNGGFSNAEWFKKYVLDLDTDDIAVDVRTITVDELTDMVSNGAKYGFNLADVDFVYLANGNYAAANTSQEEAVSTLLAHIINGSIPVVMDYSFLSSNGNGYLKKMAQMLVLNQDSEVKEAVAGFGSSSLIGAFDFSSTTDELFGTTKELLSGHVYVNDDSNGGYVSNDYLFDWNQKFADETLGQTAETKRKVTFVAVLSEIGDENFLRELEGEEKLSETLSKATITRYIVNFVSQRVSVKDEIRVLDIEPCYASVGKTSEWLEENEIISWMPGGRYEGKIERTKMSSSEFIGRIEDLNSTYDLIYLGDSALRFNTNSSGQTVFNDQNMNGLLYYNVGDAFSYSGESKENRYRLWDPDVSVSLDNGVYRTSGNDINTTRQEELLQYIRAGYAFVVADALVTTNGDGVVIPNKKTVDINSRFYGVLEEALSKNTDGSYKYYGKNVFAESMLQSQTGTEENREMFAKYLNLSKLQIVYQEGYGDSKPVSYLDNYSSSNGNDRFMKKNNATGHYEMQYIFSLRNYAAVSQVKTTYDCKLYIDNNADGRYTGSDYSVYSKDEDSEELEALTIYRLKNGAWEKVSMNYDGTKDAFRYDLTTGVIYKLVRELPDNYQGLLPWKLVFYDNSNPLVRYSEIGYSAVRSEMAQTIKVVQLISDRQNTWNLSTDNDVKSMFPYVQETTGFDIQLISVKASDFIEAKSAAKNAGIQFRSRKNGESDYEYYYGRVYDWIMDEENCNMLILGFDDNYRFGRDENNSKIKDMNMAAAEAIRDYIESGRSILFTHDSSSYINYDKNVDGGNYGWYWGYEFNKTMRAAVGLDRYGALREYYEEQRYLYSGNTNSEGYKRYDKYLQILNDKDEYQYDVAYKPNGNKGETIAQIEGLTDATVVRKLDNDLIALRDSRSSSTPIGQTNDYMYIKNSLFKQALYTNESSQMWYGQYKDFDGGQLKATPVNEGQMTMFPYLITDLTDSSTSNDYLTVAQTHNQWLQPNMELDRDGDGKNDIVVWYCLSDMTDAGKNDARSDLDNNQYYNMYNLTPNDVVNNYYIYNMGNVTYSGVGHSKPDDENIREKQLFVNTMVAAYAAGTRAPVMDVKDMYDNALDGVYLIYDEANQVFIDGIDEVKGSITVTDYNILGGNVQTRVEFFASDSSGETVSGIDEKVRKFSSANVKMTNSAGVEVGKTACDNDSVFNGYFNGGYYVVTPGQTYSLNFMLKELGILEEGAVNGSITASQVKNDNSKIYIRVTTVYSDGKLKTPNSTKEITIGVAGLFELK